MTSPIKSYSEWGYILVFALVFALGCQANSSIDFEEGFEELNFSRQSVRFQLDARTSFEFYNVHYLNNGDDEYLIQVNSLINGYNVYDIQTQRLLWQVSLDNTGPEGVSEIRGMTVVDLDTIYIYEKGNVSRISQFDIEGGYKRSLLFESSINDVDSEKFSYVNHLSSSSQPTVFQNGRLYFSKWPIFDFYLHRNIDEEFKYEFSLDLESGVVEELSIPFPFWTWGEIWNMHFLLHSKTMNSEGALIYSLYGDDTLRVYEDGLESKYWLPYSKDKTNPQPLIRAPSPIEELEEGLTNYMYTGIHYDKYRQLYYRIVERPVKFDKKVHRDFQAFYIKPLSIIVLNNSFEKVGELNLKEDTYISYGIFVGEKGLYVPRLSPNYEHFSEDYIDYSVYTVVYDK